jgi:hypothetical protein
MTIMNLKFKCKHVVEMNMPGDPDDAKELAARELCPKCTKIEHAAWKKEQYGRMKVRYENIKAAKKKAAERERILSLAKEDQANKKKVRVPKKGASVKKSAIKNKKK